MADARLTAHERDYGLLLSEVLALRAALAATGPVLAAVDGLQHPWEALCRCVDEFALEDTFACEERRQALYGAVEALLAARRHAAPAREGE